MSRKRPGQNLVQVTTHLPLADKMKLESIAGKQGKTVYLLVREIIQEFVAKNDVAESPKAEDGTQGENLL